MNSNTKGSEMSHNPMPRMAEDIPHALAEWSFFTLCLETRDQAGVRSLVYLQDQEKVLDLDTCTDPDLLAAAVAHLTREREELDRTLAKAKKSLAGATNTDEGKQTQQDT